MRIKGPYLYTKSREWGCGFVPTKAKNMLGHIEIFGHSRTSYPNLSSQDSKPENSWIGLIQAIRLYGISVKSPARCSDRRSSSKLFLDRQVFPAFQSNILAA